MIPKKMVLFSPTLRPSVSLFPVPHSPLLCMRGFLINLKEDVKMKKLLAWFSHFYSLGVLLLMLTQPVDLMEKLNKA